MTRKSTDRHPTPPVVGTAGWTIPRPLADSFPGDGRHLTRYARVLSCAEINSSFHRPHRPTTYARWATETPASFRFSVKLPRTVTHDAKLRDAAPALDRFFDEVTGLGDKLGALLVQLPPSLAFDAALVEDFFADLHERTDRPLVCEPRHRSWFEADADALLVAQRVARAAADPALDGNAARPGGWPGLAYYRWHGAPRTYWSAYDDAWLARQAADIARRPDADDVWCVFDNTAAGAALGNALRFVELLGEQGRQPPSRRRPSA